MVTVFVTVATEVGRRKTEDTGVKERTAKERVRENIRNLNKRDRKCTKY